VFSTSISNSTAIAASSSYTVAVRSEVFGVQGVKLGIRRRLPNLAIRQFGFSQ